MTVAENVQHIKPVQKCTGFIFCTFYAVVCLLMYSFNSNWRTFNFQIPSILITAKTNSLNDCVKALTTLIIGFIDLLVVLIESIITWSCRNS